MKINIKEFTGKCSCGRDHQLVVDDVILEEGALKKLPEILNKEPYNQYKHLVMVCDDNTYEAAGKEVEKLLVEIKELPDEITLEDKAKVKELFDSYDKLSEEHKLKVTNADKLINSYKTIIKLEEAEAIKDMEAKIAKLPELKDIVLDEEEKSQLRRLRQLEKAGVRRMTQDELKKIEHAERMHSYRLNLGLSIFALIISLLSLIQKFFL